MQEITARIRKAANAYLKQRYTPVVSVFAGVFSVLLATAFGPGGRVRSKFTSFTFPAGGMRFMLADFTGMKIAAQANPALRRPLPKVSARVLALPSLPSQSWALPSAIRSRAAPVHPSAFS